MLDAAFRNVTSKSAYNVLLHLCRKSFQQLKLSHQMVMIDVQNFLLDGKSHSTFPYTWELELKIRR